MGHSTETDDCNKDVPCPGKKSKGLFRGVEKKSKIIGLYTHSKIIKLNFAKAKNRKKL